MRLPWRYDGSTVLNLFNSLRHLFTDERNRYFRPRAADGLLLAVAAKRDYHRPRPITDLDVALARLCSPRVCLMSKEVVDVLIIGAGAAGAAMAWGLADTRMRIVCLEQGELMNPLAYPITGRDWEARALSDMVTNPTVRGLPGDCPRNTTRSHSIRNSRMQTEFLLRRLATH
jgi:NADPH-dependent 2,4-dienoyl-CoA reductase/sulfur reductase-like enzyme